MRKYVRRGEEVEEVEDTLENRVQKEVNSVLRVVHCMLIIMRIRKAALRTTITDIYTNY